MECHLASGGYDYLLKFVTRSVSHYQSIIEGLLERNIGIEKYFSYVIIKSPFVKTHYPLETLFSQNSLGVGFLLALAVFWASASWRMFATAVRSCWRCHDVYAVVFLFISASPCAGRHFISFSNGEKETEAKKTPTNVTSQVSPACSFRVSGT